MKKIIFLVCLVFNLNFAYAGGIVFTGDSITKGTDYGGVSSTDTFAYKIGINNGYDPADIYNAGVGGATSGGVANRLQADVISKAPDVCVLMIGANDKLTGVSVFSYKAHVDYIFDTLIAVGIKPVGITSNFIRGKMEDILAFQPYLQAFEESAAERGITVIDLYREVSLAYLYYPSDNDHAQWKLLYVDGIHLSITGHQFVADLASRPQFNNVFVK